MTIMQAIVMKQAEVLQTLSRILGAPVRVATPDAIAAVRELIQWVQFEDWESRSDMEIARLTGLLKVPFEDPLLVITEAAWRAHQGGLLIRASQLAGFIDQHLRRHGECFFNGDVIVVETQGRRIWIFHHEGCYALL